jgi:hypothetical protein
MKFKMLAKKFILVIYLAVIECGCKKLIVRSGKFNFINETIRNFDCPSPIYQDDFHTRYFKLKSYTCILKYWVNSHSCKLLLNSLYASLLATLNTRYFLLDSLIAIKCGWKENLLSNQPVIEVMIVRWCVK